MQEFSEKLRVFTKPCKYVRESNAKALAEGRKVRLLLCLAFMNALYNFMKEVCLLHLKTLLLGSCALRMLHDKSPQIAKSQ